VPVLESRWRDDDGSMKVVRLLSAIAIVYVVAQMAKEPENLDDLMNFANTGMNDLFEWGNQRLVYGQLADSSYGNATAKRRKTA